MKGQVKKSPGGAVHVHVEGKELNGIKISLPKGGDIVGPQPLPGCGLEFLMRIAVFAAPTVSQATIQKFKCSDRINFISQIDTFIETLSDVHRTRCRKTIMPARFLLKRRSDERSDRISSPFFFFNGLDFIRSILQFFNDLVGSFFIRNNEALFA